MIKIFIVLVNIIILVNGFSSLTPPSLVIRVCDGPSCSSQGSDQLFDTFCKYQEKYIKEKADITEENMFEIGTIKCVNACKRSCNVAIVPKGRATGIPFSNMNQIELTKPAYAKVRTDEQVEAIINTVANYVKNYKGERY